MTNFCRLKQPLAPEPVDIVQRSGWSPQNYINYLNLEGGEFSLPTVCSIVIDGSKEPLFLMRDEWDMQLPDNVSCCFVSHPRLSGLAALTTFEIFQIVVAVVSIAYSIYSARYSASRRPAIAAKQALGEKKPTYSFDDQKNANRIGQPLPIQYGRLRSYPDLASKPYSEFNSNDEFIYLLLMIGDGQFDIEAIQIDDTDINVFTDLEFNILPPGVKPTLFFTTVETSLEVGSNELGDEYTGPFVATAQGFVANRIDIDITFPIGLTNNASPLSVTVIGDVRRLDESGDPIGSFINVFNEIITDNTTTTLRFTFNYDVVPGEEGRYEARVRRIGETSITPGKNDLVQWTGLRAYSAAGHPDYGERTLLEIKIKATSQLNGDNIGIFNVIATRKINVWNGASFDFITSSSVIWAFYDLITNTVYGIGLDPSRVDFDDLVTLSQQFDEAGYECDIRIENSMSGMDVLGQIAQAARCQVYQRAGQILLVRDENRIAITALFTPENITKGTLSVTWNPPSVLSADHIKVTYFDRETWREEEVIAALNDSPVLIGDDVRMYGITDRQRAWEEGRFLAAQTRYRRKTIKFDTDIEGYLPDFMDKIGIGHEALIEYTTGVVQSFNGQTFFLSDPVDFMGNESGIISFKGPDGKMLGPFPAVPGPTAYQVDVACVDEIDNPIITQISAQGDRDPTTFSFGPNSSSVEATVLSIKPSTKGKVTIEAIAHDPRVFSADVGTAPLRGDTFGINVVT